MSLRLIGVSCDTDMAIADELESLEDDHVAAVANRTKPKLFITVSKTNRFRFIVIRKWCYI
jgi:purine-nucleoside phosphorylase